MRTQRLHDFGPYTILRSIATGGMAEIYLARQRAIEGVERTVVIKRILEARADDEEFITMFLDEARLLAALSHPNIAQVFDVGRVDGTYYLAMEHIRGPTLRMLLSAVREGDALLPEREALGIAVAIAEALRYAHGRRDEVGRPLDIVHRDLNPANVMVSYDGAVKLIDFGIAKAATKVYETRAGVVKGTYGYIAPEALVGKGPVDHRADIFAMGVLLYEMCVGAHPFDVSDEPNLVDRILEARYRRPREVRSELSEDLDLLISRCLSPRPERRPEDMNELLDALVERLSQERLVPTQRALAGLVHRLLPDEEGPAPLRPLARPHGPRPFGNDRTAVRTPPVDTEPRRTAIARPRPRWKEVPLQEEADDDTTVAEHPRTSTPAPEHARPSAPGATSRPVTLYVALGASALGALLLLAFGVVGALGTRTETPTVPAHEALDHAGEEAHDLHIVSEPAGARVYIDGRAVEGSTPLTTSVPSDTRQIWISVELDGYHPQERTVLVGVGEARFVLAPLPP